MIDNLNDLLKSVTAMRDHFRDFITTARKHPPRTPETALTGMWEVAKDALASLEAIRARLEVIIKKED